MTINIIIITLALISLCSILFWIEGIPKRYAKLNKKTYFIDRAGSTLGFVLRITCLKCNKTSYHPKDVENRYCGYCHEFHRD